MAIKQNKKRNPKPPKQIQGHSSWSKVGKNSIVTDVFVKRKTQVGQDEETGIIVLVQGTYFEFRREDTKHFTQLKLSKQSEYVIDLEQGDFFIQDYIVGDGGGINRVSIIQK